MALLRPPTSSESADQLLTRPLIVHPPTCCASGHIVPPAPCPTDAVQIDGLTLAAGYILVQGGGTLLVDTIMRATIYIKNTGATHSLMGERFLGGAGIIHLKGRPMGRTWTQLAADADAGSRDIKLEHAAQANGWRVGHKIAIASTIKGKESSEHTIQGISGNTITIEPGLAYKGHGGVRSVWGRPVKLAAEVIHLDRSLLITGDHADFYSSLVGLHVMGLQGGSLHVEYTRVEYAGQRKRAGRYPLHFHLMASCPSCKLLGNAIVDSQQGGVTIHGTHHSRVEENVLWNTRGVGIYVEDGNEHGNQIVQNVIMCRTADECRVDTNFEVATFASGIYMIGMTNDLIGNHVSNWQNTIFTPGAGTSGGKGAAWGKVCARHYPFGRIEDTVTHGGDRFGLYLDNQYPRNVEVDANGYLTNHDSCNEFKPDGTDNGKLTVVRRSLEYHNSFIGHYTLGDVSFDNYIAVYSHHSMYWKVSKNFAPNSAGVEAHLTNSFCANGDDPILSGGYMQFLGPGADRRPHTACLRMRPLPRLYARRFVLTSRAFFTVWLSTHSRPFYILPQERHLCRRPRAPRPALGWTALRHVHRLVHMQRAVLARGCQLREQLGASARQQCRWQDCFRSEWWRSSCANVYYS